MQAINYITSLYQPDSRAGDSLLKPQRWCNKQWSDLLKPLNNQRFTIIQISQRVIVVVALILPTLGAYGIGVVGMMVKSCQVIPNHQSSSNHLPPPIIHRAPVPPPPAQPQRPQRQIVMPYDPTNPVFNPPQERECLTAMLPPELLLRIMRFLPPEDNKTMMEVSQYMKSIAQDYAYWDPIVGKKLENEERVLGTSKWTFARNDEEKRYKYFRVQNNAPNQNNNIINSDLNEPINSYRVMSAFQRLKNMGFIKGIQSDPLDYLARLIPRGPIAFEKAIHLDVKDPQSLTPENIPKSFVVGKTAANQLFFALRIQDEGMDPIVLVFTQSNHSWVQTANPYWEEGTLNLDDDHGLNYIKRIISKEILEGQCVDFPGIRRKVKLV